MDGSRVSLGDMMAELMMDMGSAAGGAVASELSRQFGSLHSLRWVASLVKVVESA